MSAAIVLSLLFPPDHTATTTLLLQHADQASSAQAIATDAQLLKTRTVAQAAIGNLGLRVPARRLVADSRVTVLTPNILELTVTGPTGAEAARRAGETVAGGNEQFLTLSREGVESMARASQLMLEGTSELSRVWISFWNEQLTEGMEAMRALAGCRTWHEALDVQGEFTRASFERAMSRATKSAELTAEMVTSGLRPLQAAAATNVAAFPRRVA